MTPKQEQIAARRVFVEGLMEELGLSFDEVRLLLTGRRAVRELPGRTVSQVQQAVARAQQSIERIPASSVVSPITPPRNPRTRP